MLVRDKALCRKRCRLGRPCREFTAVPTKTGDQRMAAKRPEHAGGLLTIDLGAIRANWRQLRDLLGAAECAAVVKADAYGLGAVRVAPELAKAGCRHFFVAHLDE